MSEPIKPLSQDDEPQPPVLLQERHAVPGQPYELVAVAVGLFALLLLRAVFAKWHITLLVGLTLTLVVLVYLALITLQPKIQATLLAMAAAMLGLLYSMPVRMLYVDLWQSALSILLAVTWLLFTGVIGYLVARLLHVERYIDVVVAINFLGMYVIWSILFLLDVMSFL